MNFTIELKHAGKNIFVFVVKGCFSFKIFILYLSGQCIVTFIIPKFNCSKFSYFVALLLLTAVRKPENVTDLQKCNVQ